MRTPLLYRINGERDADTDLGLWVLSPFLIAEEELEEIEVEGETPKPPMELPPKTPNPNPMRYSKIPLLSLLACVLPEL